MSEAVMEPTGGKGVVHDWAKDKQVFGVPWGKAMMWIFLLSDTFIFSCFLVGYMSVRTKPTRDQIASAETLYRQISAGTASLKPGAIGKVAAFLNSIGLPVWLYGLPAIRAIISSNAAV